ncbi:MAG: FAD-binding protein [Deltaproteobacteria bacterium]|nr:FAD-binding protein [Deltaproteobacteria bacterium]MBW2103493.1 FAD-binding protein [Deltaproteobacteria bacterium]
MKKERCDVLVIGGGGAGLRAALAAREAGADTILASKARVGYGNNTYISKATIASTGFGPAEDGPAVHEQDTLEGGRFLNDPALVRKMTQGIPGEMRYLVSSGVAFQEKGEGLKVMFTPGHAHPRHVFVPRRVGGDLMLPLLERARKAGVRLCDRVFVSRVSISRDGVQGAMGFDEQGFFWTFQAASVVLATGGYAQVYRNNNNAPRLTGDGHALALEAGVSLRDMEFVQFYPTALGRHGKRLLLYEAIVFRGGAVLRNAHEEDILERHGLKDPKAATRDRLAQAVTREILEGRDVEGGLIMDLGDLAEDMPPSIRPLLPGTWTRDQKRLIVSPTTHFCMGGVITGPDAATSLPGLFAAGEVSGGLHGANRLGGNALAEVFVMGAEAGRNAARHAKDAGEPALREEEIAAEKKRLEGLGTEGGPDTASLTLDLKNLMWRHAGILRDEAGLANALDILEDMAQASRQASVQGPRDLRALLELQNMVQVSRMVCRSALLRTESRGAHFRSDYPAEDDINWRTYIVVSLKSGKVDFSVAPG